MRAAQFCRRRLGEAAPLADALRRRLEISNTLSLRQIRSDPDVLSTIDSEINLEMVADFAVELDYPADDLRKDLLRLSVNSRVVPPAVFDIIDEETTLDRLPQILEDAEFVRDLRVCESSLRANLDRVLEASV